MATSTPTLDNIRDRTMEVQLMIEDHHRSTTGNVVRKEPELSNLLRAAREFYVTELMDERKVSQFSIFTRILMRTTKAADTDEKRC
jgi:hypothetical protein